MLQIWPKKKQHQAIVRQHQPTCSYLLRAIGTRWRVVEKRDAQLCLLVAEQRAVLEHLLLALVLRQHLFLLLLLEVRLLFCHPFLVKQRWNDYVSVIFNSVRMWRNETKFNEKVMNKVINHMQCNRYLYACASVALDALFNQLWTATYRLCNLRPTAITQIYGVQTCHESSTCYDTTHSGIH